MCVRGLSLWPPPCRCHEPGLAQGRCNCPTIAAVLFQFNKGVMRNKGVSTCLWAMWASCCQHVHMQQSLLGTHRSVQQLCQAQGAKLSSAISAQEGGTMPCSGFWALCVPHPRPKGQGMHVWPEEICPQAVLSHSPHWVMVC